MSQKEKIIDNIKVEKNEINIEDNIQDYHHRLRVFFILYFFSEDYEDDKNTNHKKIFETETRIQKLDFLLRNPDYLAHELLEIAKVEPNNASDIKNIVKEIFQNNEPIIRRHEMERFFYGAYQDLDDVIGFLISVGLIDFSSKVSTTLKITNKRYFITSLAIEKVEKVLPNLPSLQWYMKRCQLIKRFFGDKKGTHLKDAQYKISEYSNTKQGDVIKDISYQVHKEFKTIYNEEL